MNVFGQRLDAHDDDAMTPLDQRKANEAWMLIGKRPEERLLAFDRWVCGELTTRLDWEWAGKQRERRIEQCRIYLERMVLGLWRRGWMLDGARLAQRIEAMLDGVGKYQRAGKVEHFWPYFCACVNRYVGANAEEIQVEAMRASTHIGGLLGALGIHAKPSTPTLPELVAQRSDEVKKSKDDTLRKRLSRERKLQASQMAEKLLFDL